MLFGNDSKEYEKKAREFNIKNDSLIEDVDIVQGHIQTLLSRKHEFTSSIRLHILTNQQAQMTNLGKAVYPIIKNLKKILKVEERYLRFITYKLELFEEETRKINKDCERITFRTVAKFVKLAEEYFLNLLKMNKGMKRILKVASKVNSKQLNYVRKCEKKIAKNKFPLDFVEHFYKFQKDEISEKTAEKLIHELQEAQKEMKNLKSRIRYIWDSTKMGFRYSAAIVGSIYFITTQSNLQGLAGAFITLSTILLSKNLKAVKEFISKS